MSQISVFDLLFTMENIITTQTLVAPKLYTTDLNYSYQTIIQQISITRIKQLYNRSQLLVSGNYTTDLNYSYQIITQQISITRIRQLYYLWAIVTLRQRARRFIPRSNRFLKHEVAFIQSVIWLLTQEYNDNTVRKLAIIYIWVVLNQTSPSKYSDHTVLFRFLLPLLVLGDASVGVCDSTVALPPAPKKPVIDFIYEISNDDTY